MGWRVGDPIAAETRPRLVPLGHRRETLSHLATLFRFPEMEESRTGFRNWTGLHPKNSVLKIPEIFRNWTMDTRVVHLDLSTTYVIDGIQVVGEVLRDIFNPPDQVRFRGETIPARRRWLRFERSTTALGEDIITVHQKIDEEDNAI